MTGHMATRQRLRPRRDSWDRLAVVQSWPDDEARVWTLDTLDEATDRDEFCAVVATGSAVRDVLSSDDLDLERPPPLAVGGPSAQAGQQSAASLSGVALFG